jgi:hypothetical protein
MGENFFDQYSLLHFSSGVVAYFFNINLVVWIVLHSIFEYVENTETGIHFINNYMPFWPGGKEKADSLLNNVGDTVFAILGWLVAYLLDLMFTKKVYFVKN